MLANGGKQATAESLMCQRGVNLKLMKTGGLREMLRMIHAARAHGIDAGRLILEGHVPRAEYLAAYNKVDIALELEFVKDAA